MRYHTEAVVPGASNRLPEQWDESGLDDLDLDDDGLLDDGPDDEPEDEEELLAALAADPAGMTSTTIADSLNERQDERQDERLPMTIVTLSFNQGRWLRECIDSVLAQLRPGIDQYIVVDPGSNDGSRALIRSYGSRIDQRVFESDAGPADGLNRGFARACGELYGYINADDRLAPGALAAVRAEFGSRPMVDVLTGAIRLIDARGRVSMRGRTSDEFDLRRFVAGTCVIAQQATFIRRDAWLRAGGFNPLNRVMWDGELLVDLALSGARFSNTSRVLGEWRQHGEAISSQRDHAARLRIEFERCRAKLVERGIEPPSPLQARWQRLCYRFDLLRHLGYLQAGPALGR